MILLHDAHAILLEFTVQAAVLRIFRPSDRPTLHLSGFEIVFRGGIMIR
jgi:hypothetical protein